MVKSVTGTINTTPVVFQQDTEDRWSVTVPPNYVDGKYLVEINVEDDAGNVTYQIAELFIRFGAVTKFEVIPQKYSVTLLAGKYDGEVVSKCKEILLSERINT